MEAEILREGATFDEERRGVDASKFVKNRAISRVQTWSSCVVQPNNIYRTSNRYLGLVNCMSRRFARMKKTHGFSCDIRLLEAREKVTCREI